MTERHAAVFTASDDPYDTLLRTISVATRLEWFDTKEEAETELKERGKDPANDDMFRYIVSERSYVGPGNIEVGYTITPYMIYMEINIEVP